MNLLEQKTAALKSNHAKALVSFITAGDPNLKATLGFIDALVAGGIDILELGMPFSDPMADGPVIQKASERALKAKTTLASVLQLVKKARKKYPALPMVLMGYYNPIFHFGLEKFVKQAAVAGANALLIVDLPPEEAMPLKKLCDQYQLCLIFLLAPTSTPDRIKLVASLASGFIYFVSLTGITGAKLAASSQIAKLIPQIRSLSHLPLMIGFGIKDPKTAKNLAPLGDGIVVGSAFVNLIEANKPKNASILIKKLAIRLKQAILLGKK